jgi:hypothetical protein
VDNAIDPALAIDTLVCKGFWSGSDCDSLSPITVDVGSAGPGDDPSILAVFPNNAPSRTLDDRRYEYVGAGNHAEISPSAPTRVGAPVGASQLCGGLGMRPSCVIVPAMS